MLTRYLRYLLAAFVLILVQKVFVSLISIERITPDVLLIFIVYLALREGQIPSMTAGFVLGLAMDVMSGELLGLAALSKTVSGFIAGYFYNKEKTTETPGTYLFILIILVSSLVHNVIYFTVYVQGTEIDFWISLLRYGLWTSLYTSIIGLIPMLIFGRYFRRERSTLE